MDIIIIIIICLATIFFEIKLGMICKEKRLLSMPVIVWMIHAIAFYLCLTIINIECEVIYVWRTSLEIHGYITILSLCIYRYLKHYKRRV